MNDQIGHYRIVRELGHGGMGTVYEVAHVDMGERRALKTFTLEHGNREFLRKRFFAEAKLLAKLDKPRLVKVCELAIDDGGKPYFVMDLVLNGKGVPETLEDARKSGRVTEKTALIRGGQTLDEVDDAVQEVFIRLVDVLRNEKIDRRKGKFRDYLATLTRRLLIDRYRAALVRPSTGSVPVAGGVTELDPGVQLDLRWRLAAHAAAVEHVLTKTAISEQSKRVYAALERGQSLREAAEAFGISYAAAKQIKSRLDRAIEAILNRL